ncbi:MAG: hypothetical protein H0X37_25495 [Herpetosiphonaceae bacterium]|nr:hypothetical protein [Herpetosiphonaceae bacterium]
MKKAIVAVAHKILTLAYTLLRKHYQELGVAFVDERRKHHILLRSPTAVVIETSARALPTQVISDPFGDWLSPITTSTW